MPIYKCPITGQNGHLHLGHGESFFDWASEYFGDYHTYEDRDLVPVPSHRIWIMANKPETHEEFIEWCASQDNLVTQAWLDNHAAEKKVPGIKKIVERVRKEKGVKLAPQKMQRAVRNKLKVQEKEQVEQANNTFLGIETTPEKVQEAMEKLARLKKIKDEAERLGLEPEKKPEKVDGDWKDAVRETLTYERRVKVAEEAPKKKTSKRRAKRTMAELEKMKSEILNGGIYIKTDTGEVLTAGTQKPAAKPKPTKPTKKKSKPNARSIAAKKAWSKRRK